MLVEQGLPTWFRYQWFTMYRSHSLSVPIPDPFGSALDAARAKDAEDAAASTAAALFGRALCRISVGRDDDARRDLEAALPEIGDACRVELAFLNMRQRGSLREARDGSRSVAEQSPAGGLLQARALHVWGLAEGKLRHTAEAVRVLLRAREAYTTLNDRWGCAAVLDTLGMVEAARGRLDYAVNFYSLSLVEKTLLNDRQGTAITLGNLGRVHLRSGRSQDAIHCFQLDLELAETMGDERAMARMHEDLARVYLFSGDFRKADEHLHESLRIAAPRQYRDLLFFAHKDLALVRIGQYQLDAAADEIRAAESLLPAGAEPYLELLLTSVRGEWLYARGDEQAIDVLQQAATGLRELDLPDLEIPVQLTLARAYLRAKRPAAAEQCLQRGLVIARGDGFGRFRELLKREMSAIGLVEGVIDEKPRPLLSGPVEDSPGYYVRETLGEGAFGKVHRVFDPEWDRDVALKQLKLHQLYDTTRRKRILDSARRELEAASRVRHPGIVRVYAMACEPDGNAYVVQELIRGKTLRDFMPGDGTAPPDLVLPCLERIADALAALHDAGVVHRDLKPENILVRCQRALKMDQEWALETPPL